MIAPRSAAAAALLLCAACATPPGAPLPPVGARTADASARAATLVRAGDYGGAARRYEEALALARSVEDADAIAANAINLSVVYQWMGRDGSARDALKLVLDDAKRPFPERRRLQAELRRAILELAAGDRAAAAEFAGRAERRCERMACEVAPTLLNVKAQIALENGDAAGAARLAQAAADAARGARQPCRAGERRYAMPGARAWPTASTRRRSHCSSRPSPSTMRWPIRARSTPTWWSWRAPRAASGDREGARGYLERAQTVSHAARDPRGMEEMEVQLKLK